MKKVAWEIPASAWQGLNSRYAPDSNLFGADEFSTGSTNFSTDENGMAVKRDGIAKYNPIALATAPRDQFEMVFNSGVRHLLEIDGSTLKYTTGDGTFATGKTGISTVSNTEFTSYQDRAYAGNGLDDNFSYDLTTSYGGVTYTVPATKKMGTLVPASAPTAANPLAGGSIPNGAHSYKVTFLYYGYEESNGSPASAVKTCTTGNNTIALSAIPVGGYGVTSRKIYRDDGDGVYVLVGTIADNTTVTFTDTVTLGTTPIPVDNNVPPKWSYAVTHRDRIWIAGISDVQSTLYYSEAGLPDIFFTNNFISCSQRDPITALSIYNDRVVVYNKASFGIIQGTTSRDFRYVEISPNVGCIDNRSIQVITVKGVPKIQWLGALGIYQWDGANLQLVSLKINNLLKFNIQQAASTRSKISQTTQADFQAGTATPGITLIDNPGNITTVGYGSTMNPTNEWDTEAEWEAGSSLTNVATKLDNKLTVPTRYRTIYDDGTHNNTVTIDQKLQLPVKQPFTGQNFYASGVSGNVASAVGIANAFSQAFVPTRSGVLGNVKIDVGTDGGNGNFDVYIAKDNGGTPGVRHCSNRHYGSATATPTEFIVPFNGVALTAGETYHLVIYFWVTNPNFNAAKTSSSGVSGQAVSLALSPAPAGNWSPDSNPLGVGWTPMKFVYNNSYVGTMKLIYDFTSDLSSQNGTWIGPTYDSLSTSTIGATLSHVATYPSGTSCVTTIEAADDDLFTTNLATQAFNNLNLSDTVTLTNKRYWRLKFVLNTNNDLITPIIDIPVIKFSQTATWISAAIDHTTDITTLDLLTIDKVEPSGTSADVTIATSSDNITYSPYTVLGSATPARYSKLKVTITSDTDNAITATVNSIRFDWSLTSTFTSSAISTVNMPAGWSYFQTVDELNGGTISYYTRSATTSGGLTAASWTLITNGATIQSPVNIWVQYKAVLSASANAVPIVSGVTVNWLTSLQQGIRVASMFYDKAYYLAAAEFNSSTNNIVLRYDENGNWAQYNGLNINTMGKFYGEPYFGSALTGYFYRWLNPNNTTDDGTNITFDLRTAAFMPESIGTTQLLTNVAMQCKGTGARIYVYYSTDQGNTWKNMAESNTGFTYYDTTNDGMRQTVQFRPASDTVTWGYSIMIRLYSSDINAVSISGLRATATISDRPVQLRS